MTTVPHRYDLMAATLKALGALGGSGSIEEIREKVIELLAVPDEVANLLTIRHERTPDKSYHDA